MDNFKTYIRYKLVLHYSQEEHNLDLETEDKIGKAVTNFLKHYYFHIKQPIIIYNSHNAYKNADAWKLNF